MSKPKAVSISMYCNFTFVSNSNSVILLCALVVVSFGSNMFCVYIFYREYQPSWH